MLLINNRRNVRTKIVREGKMKYIFKALCVILICTGLSYLIVGIVHAESQKESKYISADKCKSCHDSDRKGNQWAKWQEKKHSKAYETLSGEKAMEVAKKLGVKEPQKDAKCLKCHVTAYTEPKEKKVEDYKIELGVQCDSCHGPGEYHTETQTDILVELEFSDDDNPFGSEDDDKYHPVPEDEIIVTPDEEMCKNCHNKESPAMKEDFNFKEEVKEILHKDPRKNKD
jgi:Cytochrome c554 and c-prime